SGFRKLTGSRGMATERADGARALVVGADSLVGAALLAEFTRAGQGSYGTTRHSGSVAGDFLYLDLADDNLNLAVPKDVDVVFLVAAMASYRACEVDPLAYRVNVTNSIRLAGQVWQQGCRLVFISSNSVFGGERPFCHEDDAVSPGIAYSRHKADAEAGLRALAAEMDAIERLNIVRLTKVLTTNVPPLPDWFARLDAGERIQPFADMAFAPISLASTVASLRNIGNSGLPGVFHLSGADNVSYLAFAHCLVAEMGLRPEFVVPTTAEAAGVELVWNPRYSAIGMVRTKELLGIEPEPLDAVVARLVAERREFRDVAQPALSLRRHMP
ncbi:MAG: sugar nucleotide-binding protein, partial [Gammaproteobacteria bacterium]